VGGQPGPVLLQLTKLWRAREGGLTHRPIVDKDPRTAGAADRAFGGAQRPADLPSPRGSYVLPPRGERIVGSGEGWLTELSTSELREVVKLSAEAVA
jgi:hypothetical protein